VPEAACRIERLRLTAWAEEGLARGRILVEDAFRIASFPAEAERRLLVIRKLELGVVDPDRSSAALAPVIEEAVRAVAARAVRFDDPAAPAADAVFFPDAFAAISAFVERLAGAASPTEWFWDTVFEGRVPPGEPEAGVRLAVDRLLELPGGAVGVAVLVDVLRARGTVDRFLGWLRPTDGERLLAAFGLDAAPDHRGAAAIEPIGQAAADATDPQSPFTSLALHPWHPVLAAWTARWGESDPRSRWLAVVALVSAQPSILAHAELPVLTRRLLRAARRPPVTPGPTRPPRPGEPPSQRAPRAPSVDGAWAESAPSATGLSPPVSPADSAAPPTLRDQPVDRPHRILPVDVEEAAAVESPEPTTASWDWDLHPTAAAGLLFVLPLLSRLRIEEVLDLNSVLVEMEFPLRLLRFIADRVRVPEADAVRAPLVLARPEPPPSRFTYVAPIAWWAEGGSVLVERGADGVERRAWTDPSGRVVYAHWRGQPPAALRGASLPSERPIVAREPAPDDSDRVLESWLTRVRRIVHRQAGMGLRALVARPGQVAATRTHIDVVLPLRELDIRVRRAGLDVAPGWVPWLGLVVSFHYESEP